jgi:putative hydroxymethylpyrimidine transport system substrate-binding protein
MLISFYSNIIFSATNNNQQLQQFTVILDWFANPDHAPLFVAQQQGFFKQQGLDVKLIGPANPADPPKLVAAGKADLAITYQPQLLLDVQQGLPLVRIATLINKPLGCMAVKANNGINSIKDLKGKMIGYSTDGVDSAMLRAMLAAHDLTIKDVKLTNVNYDLTQALLTGRVDAVTGVFRNFELIQMQLAGFHAQAFYPEDNGVPPYDELILVANRTELNDPRLPRFIKALTQGEDYLQQHPQQSWQIFAKNHPELNNELNRQAWFMTLPDFAQNPGVMDPKKYDQFAQFMLKQGLITRVFPVNVYAVNLQ